MLERDHISKPEVYKSTLSLKHNITIIRMGGLVEEVASNTQIMEGNNNII